jgi:hypothetical protein
MQIKYIFFTLSFLIVLAGSIVATKNQSMAQMLGLTPARAVIVPPTVSGYAAGDSEDSLYIYISWDMKDATEYGYRIDKEGVNGRETAAIFDPAEFGVDDRTGGGFYLDPAVILGDTYNYYIYTFDRAGRESAPAKVTVDAIICGDQYRSDGTKMELQWVCPPKPCPNCKK